MYLRTLVTSSGSCAFNPILLPKILTFLFPENKNEENVGNNNKNDETQAEVKEVDPEILDILGIDEENKPTDLIVDPDLIGIWAKLVNKGLKKEKLEVSKKKKKMIKPKETTKFSVSRNYYPNILESRSLKARP